MGLRPTTGSVSKDGVVPVALSIDTVGPMTRCVMDTAHVLSAIAGKSDEDEKTHEIPFLDIPDISKACSGTNLAGVRLGVPRKVF